jgi:uncharacterized protein (TIGR02284 family)
MADQTQRTVLNHLIEICRDAERGFRTAADQVQSAQLKGLFHRLADQRREFGDELLPHAFRLGGAPLGEGTCTAALHRLWMRVRVGLASHPERAIVDETRRGEQYALAAYADAAREIIVPEARELVEAQRFGLRVADRLVADATGR